MAALFWIGGSDLFVRIGGRLELLIGARLLAFIGASAFGLGVESAILDLRE